MVINKKGGMAVSQIIILIVGVVAFSWMVSGVYAGWEPSPDGRGYINTEITGWFSDYLPTEGLSGSPPQPILPLEQKSLLVKMQNHYLTL